METSAYLLPEFQLADKGKRDFRKDSIRNADVYKSALSLEPLTGLDAIRHPFSALSKRNQRIWAFQKMYNQFEREKYIDYTFTEALVSSLTGLRGDSCQTYLRMFRPSYEALHSMSEYNFYAFIKESVALFRSGRRNRFSPTRSTP
jgi:hypothetical protein